MTILKSKPVPSARAKADRAEDAARAIQEYEEEKRAVLAKTARLRELRLAKETGARAEQQIAPPARPKPKKRAARR